MSCVLPDKNALESGVSAACEDSHARLCRELDEGLHALAQPLTILRGALGALAMRGAVSQEASRYLEMSNAQVDNMCDLLTGLRNLLDEEERMTEIANRSTSVYESFEQPGGIEVQGPL
jgi:hypothetical protein